MHITIKNNVEITLHKSITVISGIFSSKNNKKRLKSGIFSFIRTILAQNTPLSRILLPFLCFFQPSVFTFANIWH